MSNSPSPSSASFAADSDRATGRLPDSGPLARGEDPLSAEPTGELPELGELGDEDIIADGGTQIMSREPALGAAPVSKAPSSLDALAATIPAKSAKPAVAAVASIPPAPKTEPIHELDPDDLEEDEQRRIERTQPFDRSRLFGAPRPGDGQPAPRPMPAAGTPAAAQAQAARPMPPPAAVRVTTPSVAWRPAPVPRLDLVVSPTPPPASTNLPAHLPSVVVNDAPPAQQHRPASIAPLAVDVARPRAVPDGTLELPAVHHVPGLPKTNTPAIAAAIAGGLALCAAAVIALVSFSSGGPSTSTRSTPTVAAKPREAQKGAVRSAVIETPETTPQKAAPPPGTEDEDGTPVYSPGALPSAPAAREASGAWGTSSSPSFAQAAPARTATGTPRAIRPAAPPQQPVAAPEPAPPPVAAAPPPAPPRPAPPPPTTGTIEVPGSLMTVMVDGDYKRVQNGRIVVTCGKHKVNAGRGTQVVDVPCGGVASVM